MESGYQQEPVAGGGVRFTVTPAPAPRAVGAALALAGAFALLILVVPAPDGTGRWAVRPLLAAIVGVAVFPATERWLTRRGERSRAPGGSFVVSPGGIETGDTRLPRERLRRLIVTNAVPGSAEPTSVAAGTAYLDTPGLPPGFAGRARAAVSYLLCAEEGDRSTTLAGGMTALTAHGLLTEVSRILSRG
ncbi:MAG TPA: hypothetical protein VLV15_06825 [Dongiaceae bacterium]|nr:hypothetical protein [Dongiaceae bacterium]